MMLLLSGLLLPLAASAAHVFPARQASSSGASSPTATSTSSAPAASSPMPASSPSSSSPTDTASPAATTLTDTATPTLISTNPTAMPLTNIIATPVTDVTYAVYTSYAPGATPPVSGAPPLPSGIIIPTDWPALDLVPDTNSTQVQQWMQELNGYDIPDFAPTIPGGCETNPGLIGNETLCWWTCGECTRETDITTCPDEMTWGLSYDDGPTPYTPALLNYMEQQDLKSTFFIVGSRAISRPEILQDEYMAGHQLCVHTWSHPYLTTLTTPQIVAELGWTREAIKQITGVSPNCARPPYGDVDDRVRAIAQAMGMTWIIWTSYQGTDFDTNDWYIPGGRVTANDVLATFDQVLYQYAPKLNTGFIVLEHDLYQQTVDLAVGYVLPNALAQNKFKMMPIISCLHKPLEDSYVETNNNLTNPVSAEWTTLAPTQSGATLVTSGVGQTPTGSPSNSASMTSAASAASTASSSASSTAKASGAMVSKALAGGVTFGLALVVGAVAFTL